MNNETANANVLMSLFISDDEVLEAQDPEIQKLLKKHKAQKEKNKETQEPDLPKAEVMVYEPKASNFEVQRFAKDYEKDALERYGIFGVSEDPKYIRTILGKGTYREMIGNRLYFKTFFENQGLTVGGF